MISEKETIRISKFLSLVLRHRPEIIGLAPDENGWVDVGDLIKKLATKGFDINLQCLQQVVKTNSKQRFAFNDDETKIRASQGHSIKIDLGYQPNVPPKILYHGTTAQNIQPIMEKGLLKQSRQHVHLSADRETAIKVGQRHGKPTVIEVKAYEMHKEGYSFYLSANGVWLTNHVPAKYLGALSFR